MLPLHLHVSIRYLKEIPQSQEVQCKIEHFEDIGSIYTEQIVPSTDAQVLSEGQVVGDMQQLDHDGSALRDTGPESADGFLPADNDSKKKSKKELDRSAHSEDKLSQPLVAEGKKKNKKKNLRLKKKENDEIGNKKN